jgi:ABC-type transport system involved in Fe-S cluster assembly fused permease/ATPase subunit
LLHEILDLAGIDNNLDEETLSKLYWYGYKDDQTWTQTQLMTMIILFDAFRYVIFKNRQRKILPTGLNFKIELCNFLYWIGRFNKKIKLAYKIVFRGTILLQAIG